MREGLQRLAASPFYLGCVCLVTLCIWIGVLRGVSHTFLLSPADIRPDGGSAYMAPVPSVVYGVFVLRADKDDAPLRSVLELFENERQLGPGHAHHPDIRQLGAGRFSHRGERVYFSTTDNTDPARNGRTYRAVATVKIPFWACCITFIVTFGLLLSLFRARAVQLQRADPIPSLHQPLLNRAVFGVLLLAIVAQLPGLLSDAARADAKLNHAIPMTAGDDGTYQVLAVNLLHGVGYYGRLLLPIERYRLNLAEPGSAAVVESFPTLTTDIPSSEFRRSPGLSLMLAAVYKVFGTDTIVAQRMMALLTWLTALSLLVTGAVLAGWIGSLAGGLSALYHLNYFPGINHFERVLSENPTAFWVAFFALGFTLYLKRDSKPLLVLSAISLAAVILMRANFVFVLPLLVLYLTGEKRSWRSAALFAAVATLPLLLWSGYASLAVGRPVLITQAGPRLFANTNNFDALDGLGPERWNQGGWNPGFNRHVDGRWVVDGHNQIKPGENGWLKGLTFWRNNLTRVPELFYVKLRVGFWFNNGGSLNWLRPEGFFLIGVAYLLLTLGFLPLKLPWLSALRLPPEPLLAMQLVLIVSLFFLWNSHGLLPVLAVWGFLLCLSVLRLSGRQQPLPCPNPTWFLAFVVCHAITTILFYGIRFHQPLDANLMLIGFLGILLTIRETARQGLWLPLSFVSVLLLYVLRPIY